MNYQEEKIYTCPMHPEIQQDKPGRCPKCGMALVIAGAKQHAPIIMTSDNKGLGVLTWKSYIPLFVIILLITIASAVVSRVGTLNDFVVNFMTGFFLVFGGFKLLDLKGFAEGYSMYDLLAKKLFGYGYIYPFIELSFGFLMLSGFHPAWLLWTEFGVMAFSGLGVAIKVARREPFICACLGTFLKVPLTSVTLIEDFGMASLALLVIFLK